MWRIQGKTLHSESLRPVTIYMLVKTDLPESGQVAYSRCKQTEN